MEVVPLPVSQQLQKPTRALCVLSVCSVVLSEGKILREVFGVPCVGEAAERKDQATGIALANFGGEIADLWKDASFCVTGRGECHKHRHRRYCSARSAGEGQPFPVEAEGAGEGVPLPAVDILVAGAPCQPYSKMRKGSGRKLSVEEHPGKDALSVQLPDIISSRQPFASLFEQVGCGFWQRRFPEHSPGTGICSSSGAIRCE